jgi:hypothetical protein
VNHERHAEEVETHHSEDEVLEATYEADGDCERHAPKAGPDAVYIVNISGIGDGEVMNGLQVAKKSGIPEARRVS